MTEMPKILKKTQTSLQEMNEMATHTDIKSQDQAQADAVMKSSDTGITAQDK
jgi:hypothetical protein